MHKVLECRSGMETDEVQLKQEAHFLVGIINVYMHSLEMMEDTTFLLEVLETLQSRIKFITPDISSSRA